MALLLPMGSCKARAIEADGAAVGSLVWGTNTSRAGRLACRGHGTIVWGNNSNVE